MQVTLDQTIKKQQNKQNKMKKLFIKILTNILESLNKIINYLNREHSLKIISVSYTNSGRYLIYHYHISSLKRNSVVLFNLYTSLMNNDRFINFGFNKVIITSSVINSSEYSFHHNILLTNNTTFDEYYNQVIDYIDTHYDSDNSYGVEVIPSFKVKVWNMENYLNKKIIFNIGQVNKKYSKSSGSQLNKKRGYSTMNSNITPIKNILSTGVYNPISAMDIETIDYNGIKIPISLTIARVLNGNQILSKIILIDYKILLLDKELALNNLWNDCLNYIIKSSIEHIFVHNLGNFDGYFIYKALSEKMEPKFVNTIIDNQNKFITINMKTQSNKVKWLDSYRILHVKLNDLCEVFGVEGKSYKYNPKFNSLDLFYEEVLLNEFKEYSVQDSVALLKALFKAQEIYLRDFNIDITSIVSTSSLSL
jgi:hypothetical protein